MHIRIGVEGLDKGCRHAWIFNACDIQMIGVFKKS